MQHSECNTSLHRKTVHHKLQLNRVNCIRSKVVDIIKMMHCLHVNLFKRINKNNLLGVLWKMLLTEGGREDRSSRM